MDKPCSYQHRRGIALLITLVTIAVMMALVGTLVSALSSVQKDSRETTTMLQANIYYADIVNVFKKIKDKEGLLSTLYLAPIPFSTDDGNFFVTVGCRPLTNGVNINWLGYENDIKMSSHYDITQKLFAAITAKYTLSDPLRLEEMLMEVIGTGSQFQQKYQSRLLQKRGIISYQQFEHVINRYQLETDDPVVASIPWKRLFSFVPESNLIDGDYMSEEAVSLLFDMDPATVEEEWLPGSGAMKTFAQKHNLEYEKKIYAQKFVEYAECDVQYVYAQKSYSFTFVYNKGEVKHFEFSGRQ